MQSPLNVALKEHFFNWPIIERQSSSAISDVKSPVKLVGKICDQFQASSANSDSVNWPEDEAVNFENPDQNKPITTRCPDSSPRDRNQYKGFMAFFAK